MEIIAMRIVIQCIPNQRELYWPPNLSFVTER